MNNLTEIMNEFFPGIVVRVARTRDDFPNGEGLAAVPFFDTYVLLAPRAVLPSAQAVLDKVAAYDALVAQRAADAAAAKVAPDVAVQMLAMLIGKKLVAAADVAQALTSDALDRVNSELAAAGMTVIPVKAGG